MNKNKILVIDDDVDLLASIKLLLESNGYVAETAKNTTIGMNIIKSFNPDIIILDIMMDTNLEGYNFLRLFKADEKLNKIPIVMYSNMAKALGVNMLSVIEDVEELPKTKFVDKSNDLEELLNAVKAFV
jgi:DNA-binding response OmpR family regulator